MKILISFFLFCSVGMTEPLWMQDPSMSNKYVGAIGSCKAMKSKRKQKKRAMIQAKGALSHAYSVYVDTNSTLIHDSKGNKSLHTVSTQKSNNLLLPKVMDSYTSPDKTLYIWMVME